MMDQMRIPRKGSTFHPVERNVSQVTCYLEVFTDVVSSFSSLVSGWLSDTQTRHHVQMLMYLGIDGVSSDKFSDFAHLIMYLIGYSLQSLPSSGFKIRVLQAMPTTAQVRMYEPRGSPV